MHPIPPEGGAVTVVEVNGRRLDYDIQGDGAPILALGNLAQPRERWPGPHVPTLTNAGYQVVSFQHFEPTGHRKDATRDIASLIEHVGLAPVHLWGYSAGAVLALELILLRPDLVRAAVLMAGGGRLRAFQRWLFEDVAELMARGGSDPEAAAVAQALYALVSFTPQQLADDAVIAPMLEFMKPSQTSADDRAPRARQTRRNDDYGYLSELGAITTPCLVIGFELDLYAFAASCRELAEAIPGARYVEIPRAGHTGIDTHTDEVFGHMLGFLADA